MWAVSSVPPTSFFSKPTEPLFRSFAVTLPRTASIPPQNDGDYGKDIGTLGHTLITAANSDVKSGISPVTKRQKQKQNQGEGKELSGSDVLWALQRAAAKKNKKNKKKRELSSAGSDKKDDSDYVDYSNVNPLCVKGQWAVKLNELEKRLQELSEIK